MKKTYFIGGPLDGKSFETDSDRYVVEIFEKPSASVYDVLANPEQPFRNRVYYQLRSLIVDGGPALRIGSPEGQSFAVEFAQMLERRASQTRDFDDEVTAWRNCARRLAHLVRLEHGRDPGIVQYEELENKAQKREFEELSKS